MTIRRRGLVISLEGDCHVEEAEALAALLEEEKDLTVDLSQCRHLHTALVQTLLRFRPAVTGASENAFIRRMITPALATPGV